MKNYCLVCFLFILSLSKAQLKIIGKVTDVNRQAIPFATVILQQKDSTKIQYTQTDSAGYFTFKADFGITYNLKISALNYKTLVKKLEPLKKNYDLGIIQLQDDGKLLKEVEVKVVQERGKQNGDTTQFNANAFKTNPDATAEDLIKKMPGVTSNNNGIKVNGETVQKVLLDGKPFFGDDPNAALKNLPADMIDKVEIFDKMSDQAAFTGFNDDNTQKSINFVSKKNRANGQFGRIFAGVGSEDNLNFRYNAGCNLNTFKGKKRISLLLLSNNVNVQNFSISDISGALANTNQSGGGQGRGGRGNNNSSSNLRPNDPSNNLLTAAQNGITETQALGLNFSNDWKNKTSLTGSYFFNYGNSKNNSTLFRNYFSQNGLLYNQAAIDETFNTNHKLNLRVEHKIDSNQTIVITPVFIYQNNNLLNRQSTSNSIPEGIILSLSNSNSKTVNKAYDFTNTFLYMLKLNKIGRTLSLSLLTQLNEKNNFGNYNSATNFSLSAINLNQNFKAYSYGKRVSPTLSYTEPLGKRSQLQLNYSPSLNIGLLNKITTDFDSVTETYNLINPNLSNKYSNNYFANRGGVTYRFNKNKLNFNIGAEYQHATLTGEQELPVAPTIKQSFNNVLPNMRINYKFSSSKNWRFNYRTSTNIPSLAQLQDVVDISNQLQPKVGNPKLKQSFEHSIFTRFGGFNMQKAINTSLFFNFVYTSNYIASSLYTLANDSIINNVTLFRGSQLSKFENLNNNYTLRCFYNYGFPLKALKSNMNINLGVTHSNLPSKTNFILNEAKNTVLTAGFFIGSNISEKLDFSLGYNINANDVRNSTLKNNDGLFTTHSTNAKLNWNLYRGLIFNLEGVYTYYLGLTNNLNQQFLICNAYLAYKFLKNKQLETKISVNDAFKQNVSIGRIVTSNYNEDFSNLALQRYFLFTLTYTIKKFGGDAKPKTEKDIEK